MTTCPLPHIAAELDLCSGVYYAAEPASCIVGNDEHLIVWMPGPTMAAEAAQAYRWVKDDRLIGTPHATLDSIALTKLLFIRGVEPLELDDAAVLDAVNHSLAETHCDMLRCSRRACALLDKQPMTAGTRWRHCEIRAARLLGTEA